MEPVPLIIIWTEQDFLSHSKSQCTTFPYNINGRIEGWYCYFTYIYYFTDEFVKPEKKPHPSEISEIIYAK